MRIPDVDIVVTPVRLPMERIMRAERTLEKVRQQLLRTCRALESAGVPYAVIGGHAVAVWVASHDEGAVRNTKNVDILIERGDLARSTEAMGAAGFDFAEVDGVPKFIDQSDPMQSRGVHIVFAREKIKPHDAHPAPAVTKGLRTADGVQAIQLRDLLVLKLTAFRDIDRVHVRDMLQVGLIDDAVAEQMPAELRPRLEEILANPDG